MRKFVCTLSALLVLGVSLIAGELKGTIKSGDADKKVITISVDGKDTEVSITDDTKIVRGENAVKDREKALKGLYNAKEGKVKVTVTTEKKDGKEVATEIKMAGKPKDKQ